MLDEFPETFWLVFVYHIDSSTNRFLDAGSILCQLKTFVFLFEGCHLIRSIKDDGDLSVREVHIAVSFGMINPKAIVIVDDVSCIFVGSV